MQNKAARLVSHFPLRAPRKEIYATLGWLSVNQLVFYHSMLSTFRIRQSGEPEYLSNLQARDGRTGRIIISNTTLTLAKRSYSYRASAQWNSIPDNNRNIRRVSQFKVQLRKWILLHVDQFVDAHKLVRQPH